MPACPACGFENMKGGQVCARCRGRLVWDGPGSKADFRPPRAGRGQAGRRALFFLRAKTHSPAAPARLIRPLRAALAGLIAIPMRGWRRLPFANKLAALMSLIPGLGQASLEKYPQAAAAFLGWLALIGLMVSLYSNAPLWFLHLAGPLWFGAWLFHVLAAVFAAVPDYRRADRELRSAAVLIAAAGALAYLVAGYLIQPHLIVTTYEYRPAAP